MNLRTERRRLRLVPRSLLGRMLLLTLLAVLLAQGLSSLIWLSQLRASQMEGLLTSARSLAQSMAASVSYFRSLLLGYRPLVLDQLRSTVIPNLALFRRPFLRFFFMSGFGLRSFLVFCWEFLFDRVEILRTNPELCQHFRCSFFPSKVHPSQVSASTSG